jgi:hypothetical protein
MSALEGISAITITIIKKFKFPEPVFRPRKLHKKNWLQIHLGEQEDARFLSSSSAIQKLFTQDEPLVCQLDDNSSMKRICKLYIPQELFWNQFKGNAVEEGLPLLPFKVILPDEIVVDKKSIKKSIGSLVKDVTINFEAWFFPCGIATAYLSFTIVPQGVDLSCIRKFTADLATLPIRSSDGKTLTTFNFILSRMASLFKLISNEPIDIGAREIGKYYVCYTLTGVHSAWKDHEDELANLLIGGNWPVNAAKMDEAKKWVDEGIGRPRHEDDLAIVGDRAAIFAFDAGLKETAKKNTASALVQLGVNGSMVYAIKAFPW